MLRLTVALILTAAIAAPAEAAVVVSPSHVQSPALAVNASGRTAVAWTRSVGRREFVEARLGTRPTELAPPVRIVEGSVADLALGADGTAALAMRTRSRLLIAIARPGHGFGRPQAFPALAGDVQLAVQPDGNVVAIRTVWGPMPEVAPHRELLFTSARAGGRFGAFQPLVGEVGIADASLAIDPRDGTALLFYGNGYSGEPFAGFRLAVAPFVLGGTNFGAAQTIASGAGDPGTCPRRWSGLVESALRIRIWTRCGSRVGRPMVPGLRRSRSRWSRSLPTSRDTRSMRRSHCRRGAGLWPRGR